MSIGMSEISKTDLCVLKLDSVSQLLQSSQKREMQSDLAVHKQAPDVVLLVGTASVKNEPDSLNADCSL